MIPDDWLPYRVIGWMLVAATLIACAGWLWRL